MKRSKKLVELELEPATASTLATIKVQSIPLSSYEHWWERDCNGHAEVTVCQNCHFFESVGKPVVGENIFEGKCRLLKYHAFGGDYSCPGFVLGRFWVVTFRLPGNKMVRPRWAINEACETVAAQRLHEPKPIPGAPFDDRWKGDLEPKEEPFQSGLFDHLLGLGAKLKTITPTKWNEQVKTLDETVLDSLRRVEKDLRPSYLKRMKEMKLCL